jgi:hypothetical protein
MKEERISKRIHKCIKGLRKDKFIDEYKIIQACARYNLRPEYIKKIACWNYEDFSKPKKNRY